MKPIASILALSMALAGCAAAATDAPGESSAKAMEVLERTRTTDATYALYVWNRIAIPGQEPVEEWSAEFHSGDLHRVETPRDRVVADCGAGTGTALSLATGEVTEGPQIAGAACGINANAAITGAQWVGPVQTPLGSAERVRILDREHVRDYDVAANGALLRTAYSENRPGGRLLLTATAVGLEPALPEAAMFDRKSLERSFVPDRYKAPPAR